MHVCIDKEKGRERSKDECYESENVYVNLKAMSVMGITISHTKKKEPDKEVTI